MQGLHSTTDAPRPPRLVLGFGNLGTRAIREGIRTIAELLNEPV
jgi:hypothetical protein